MRIRPLSIAGAWEITPLVHADKRGQFLEWFRPDCLAEVVGHPVAVEQGNLSTSVAGAVRGIHFADVPPGQAKYVSCVHGEIWDVVVDLRVGSPTFGRWEAIGLDDVDRRGLYLAEGLGHGFCALSPGATALYLCSTGYSPSAEHTVHPLDPRLSIAWPTATPVMSSRDRAAPSLSTLLERKALPSYEECRSYLGAG